MMEDVVVIGLPAEYTKSDLFEEEPPEKCSDHVLTNGGTKPANAVRVVASLDTSRNGPGSLTNVPASGPSPDHTESPLIFDICGPSSDSRATSPADSGIPMIETEMESEMDSEIEGLVQVAEEPTGPPPPSYLRGYRCWVCQEVGPDVVACECRPAAGSAHRRCLVHWMNSHVKGRCPRCAMMFRVVMHSTPLKEWHSDPHTKKNSVRYALLTVVFFFVTIISIIAVTKLLQSTSSNENSSTTRIKGIIAGTLILSFLFYCFCQFRMYSKVYERLRLYNNKVLDVYEKGDEGDFDRRGNFSSYVKDYELPIS